MFKIAVVGRENVGKSTFFNKICRKNISIISDVSGVTRDYISSLVTFENLKFELIDTAGWHSSNAKRTFSEVIKSNLKGVLETVDLIVFMVDAKTPITSEDAALAKIVLKLGKKVIFLANKAEGKKHLTQAEAMRLGFGEPIYISSAHKLGFQDFYDELSYHMKDVKPEEDDDCALEDEEGKITISIIGRPNVGKSTLFNSILGFDRSIVSNIAHTTRDFVTYDARVIGKDFQLIDTAGIRRHAKVEQGIEKISVKRALQAIKMSDVVFLIMDAQTAFEKQDLIIANLTLENNKLLIPVINKSDLISNRKEFDSHVAPLMKKKFTNVMKDSEILYISAKNKKNIDALFSQTVKLWQVFKRKITTSVLNNWLRDLNEEGNQPRNSGKIPIKVKYVRQSSIKPPVFDFFINKITGKAVGQHFEKFLLNEVKQKFEMKGVPVKINIVPSKNPFIKK